MGRKVLFLTLAIVALAAFAAFAQDNPYRQGYEGDRLPNSVQNPGTFQLDENGNWVPATYAYSFNSEGADSDGMSNKEIHSFNIVNHVSVAQWIKWSISGTRKDWRVLRPGTYASDSVTAKIASNNDVVIEFWAEDPEYLEEDRGVTRTIPKWFSYSEGVLPEDADLNGWLPASETSEENPFVIRLTDSAALHEGLTYKIWEKIEVLPSHSSSDYEGTGKVTIYLTNIKHWVDGVNGGFYEGGFGRLDPQWVE